MTYKRNQWMGLVALLAFPVTMLGQGTVSGVLNDEKGKAYGGGARVMVIKVAERPDGFEPFVSHAVTGKDGSYRIGNVPTGKYEICVLAPGGDYVNTCQWGKAAATALVAKGGTAVVNVSLTKGRVFTIDLKDDDGYLDRHENKSVGGFLEVGVSTDKKEFVEAAIGSLTKNERRYRVVVPVGVKFRVRMQSPLFDVKMLEDTPQTLTVLQDLDQMMEEKDTTKGVSAKVGGIKVVQIAR